MRHARFRLAGSLAAAATRLRDRGRVVALLGPSVALALGAIGCTPAIGDKCNLSTDCSIQGTRQCDTSQTGGYCTIADCTADSCPDNAVCVDFGARVPGCGYDDYQAPSRTSRPMCMKACGSDSDCRQGDGFACRNPTGEPWEAVILDTSRASTVCIEEPALVDAGPPPAPPDGAISLCSSGRLPPPPPPAEGGEDDGAAEAATDAGTDAGLEAVGDAGAGDGPTEATGDAADGGAGAGESGADGDATAAGDGAFDATLAEASPADATLGDAGAGDATLADGSAGDAPLDDGAAGDAVAADDADDAMADGAPDADVSDAPDGG
jgi:hypothetical protein